MSQVKRGMTAIAALLVMVPAVADANSVARPHVSAGAAPVAAPAPAAAFPPVPTAKPIDPLAAIRTIKTVVAPASAATSVDVTVEDLQAALAEAQAQVPPDVVSATCYEALIPVVQASLVPKAVAPSPVSAGPFLTFQRTRNAKAVSVKPVEVDPLASLNVACAPMVLDSKGTLDQLGTQLQQLLDHH